MSEKKVYTYGIGDDMNLGIYAMSLVEEPAIMVDFVLLAQQQQIKLTSVDKDRQIIYGPALIPDIHILRVDQSTGEEYYITYPREEVEKAAHLLLKKNLHHNVTLEHILPIAGAYIAELWVKEGEQDKSTHLGIKVPDGTMMIGMKVEDPELWNEVKTSGKFRGFSLEGFFKEMPTNLSDQAMEREFLASIEKLLKDELS